MREAWPIYMSTAFGFAVLGLASKTQVHSVEKCMENFLDVRRPHENHETLSTRRYQVLHTNWQSWTNAAFDFALLSLASNAQMGSVQKGTKNASDVSRSHQKHETLSAGQIPDSWRGSWQSYCNAGTTTPLGLRDTTACLKPTRHTGMRQVTASYAQKLESYHAGPRKIAA